MMIQPQNALRVATGAVLCIFHVKIQLPLRFVVRRSRHIPYDPREIFVS
jgi:hypothetical protein